MCRVGQKGSEPFWALTPFLFETETEISVVRLTRAILGARPRYARVASRSKSAFLPICPRAGTIFSTT